MRNVNNEDIIEYDKELTIELTSQANWSNLVSGLSIMIVFGVGSLVLLAYMYSDISLFDYYMYTTYISIYKVLATIIVIGVIIQMYLVNEIAKDIVNMLLKELTYGEYNLYKKIIKASMYIVFITSFILMFLGKDLFISNVKTNWMKDDYIVMGVALEKDIEAGSDNRYRNGDKDVTSEAIRRFEKLDESQKENVHLEYKMFREKKELLG